MSRTRLYYKVGPSFWTDYQWDDDARLAALYVLTSPHRTTEGLFRMPLEYAATDLGWTLKRFDRAFGQLLADGFVEYDSATSVCLIVNALKWQRPGNPNQVTAAVRALDGLPATPLLNRFRTIAATLAPTLAEQLTKRLGEPLAKPLAGGFAHSPAPAPYSNSKTGVGGGLNEMGDIESPPLHTIPFKQVSTGRPRP